MIKNLTGFLFWRLGNTSGAGLGVVGCTEAQIWAVTCDFQQCGILTSVHSDELVQPPFKFRNSKFGSVSSLTHIEYSSDKQRLWSDCAYVQADLRLCWSHIPHCWKSHVAAHLSFWLWSFGISSWREWWVEQKQKFLPYGLTGYKSISKIFIPNFVYVLTNKRYETHRTKFSFCRLSCTRVGLGGTWGSLGGGVSKILAWGFAMAPHRLRVLVDICFTIIFIVACGSKIFYQSRHHVQL